MPEGSRKAKDELFEGFATVAKALASGRRTEIVEVLSQAPRTVQQVAEAIDQSVANTSHHLQVLARAGLVEGRRDGTHVIYQLAGERVAELWAALRDVAADRLAEIDRLARAYLGDTSEVETISAEELRGRLAQGEVVLLDVRPELEYRAGHIPGARSVPVQDLTEVLDELPRDADIVAYCRGPYCVFADEAVRQLRARGFRARRLREGIPEWRSGDHPVETASGPPEPSKEGG